MTKYDVLCLYKTKDITMDILRHMVDLTSSCGYVTVNQYLEMSGIDDCSEGGNEWGWYAKTIMDTVGVKTRCGWILDLGNPCLVVEKPKNGRYSWLNETETTTGYVYNSEHEALRIRDTLLRVASEFGYVTQKEFDMLNNTLTPVSNDQMGWDLEMLKNTEIKECFCGYILKICTPVEISSLKKKRKNYQSTEVAILIDHAQKSIQKYVEYSNLNELKTAKDILITAISVIEIENMEDKESEEK